MEKWNHVVEYKLKCNDFNLIAELWDQIVYSKTIWIPDAGLGSQTLMSKMGCNKFHTIKLEAVWTQKKEYILTWKCERRV